MPRLEDLARAFVVALDTGDLGPVSLANRCRVNIQGFTPGTIIGKRKVRTFIQENRGQTAPLKLNRTTDCGTAVFVYYDIPRVPGEPDASGLYFSFNAEDEIQAVSSFEHRWSFTDDNGKGEPELQLRVTTWF